MSTTIILHSNNKNGNTYSDCVFNIHVPLHDQMYRLQLQSFMFRPIFNVITSDDFLRVKLKMLYHPALNDNYPKPSNLPQELEQEFHFTCLPLSFQGNGYDEKFLNDLMSFKEIFELKDITYNEKYDIEILASYFQDTNKIGFGAKAGVFINHINYDYLVTGIEITGISKRFSYITGFQEGQSEQFTPEDIEDINIETERLILIGNEIYRPYYWDLISLNCNKVVNIGKIINQTIEVPTIDKSSMFNQYSIIGYVPNSCGNGFSLINGLPTQNKYVIQPASFNMIRFRLLFQNNEPVELLSPMTIILNLIPL